MRSRSNTDGTVSNTARGWRARRRRQNDDAVFVNSFESSSVQTMDGSLPRRRILQRQANISNYHDEQDRSLSVSPNQYSVGWQANNLDFAHKNLAWPNSNRSTSDCNTPYRTGSDTTSQIVCQSTGALQFTRNHHRHRRRISTLGTSVETRECDVYIPYPRLSLGGSPTHRLRLFRNSHDSTLSLRMSEDELSDLSRKSSTISTPVHTHSNSGFRHGYPHPTNGEAVYRSASHSPKTSISSSTQYDYYLNEKIRKTNIPGSSPHRVTKLGMTPETIETNIHPFCGRNHQLSEHSSTTGMSSIIPLELNELPLNQRLEVQARYSSENNSRVFQSQERIHRPSPLHHGTGSMPDMDENEQLASLAAADLSSAEELDDSASHTTKTMHVPAPAYSKSLRNESRNREIAQNSLQSIHEQKPLELETVSDDSIEHYENTDTEVNTSLLCAPTPRMFKERRRSSSTSKLVSLAQKGTCILAATQDDIQGGFGRHSVHLTHPKSNTEQRFGKTCTWNDSKKHSVSNRRTFQQMPSTRQQQSRYLHSIDVSTLSTSRASDFVQQATNLRHSRRKGVDALDLASSVRAFGAATTSLKSLTAIMRELKKALQSSLVNFEELGPAKLRCSCSRLPTTDKLAARQRRVSLVVAETIEWEITVQFIPDLDMHGIQLRRIKGNHWEYKRVVDDVIRKAKL